MESSFTDKYENKGRVHETSMKNNTSDNENNMNWMSKYQAVNFCEMLVIPRYTQYNQWMSIIKTVSMLFMSENSDDDNQTEKTEMLLTFDWSVFIIFLKMKEQDTLK